MLVENCSSTGLLVQLTTALACHALAPQDMPPSLPWTKFALQTQAVRAGFAMRGAAQGSHAAAGPSALAFVERIVPAGHGTQLVSSAAASGKKA